MNRNEVFDVISSERDYQVKQSENELRPDMIPDFHLGDALSAIRYNLARAEEEWYKGAVPHQEAMVYLRKIAALCVMQGEKHGMPKR